MITDWSPAMPAVDPGWILLSDVIARVTILFVLAVTIHVILGRRRALIRSGLWNAVLLASMLQPAMTLVLPRLRISCLSSAAGTPAAAESSVPRESQQPLGAPLSDVARIPEELVATSLEPVDPLPPGSERGGGKWSVLAAAPWLLTGLYAAGVLVLSLRLVTSLWAIRRLKRTAAVVDDPSWTGPLTRWRAHLGIARPVVLLRSGRVRVPLVLGWHRPAIVLPAGEEGPASRPRSQVNAVLLHELAHLRRGDDFWNLIQQVVAILYWPHPLTWLMGRLIAGVREQACDDLCVRWVGGADEYRSALIAAASRLVGGRVPSFSASPGLAMARASSSALLGRIRWIERTSGATACILHWPGRVAIGLAVLGVASLLATIEPARVGAAQSNLPPADDALVRAYDQPVPVSGKFHTVSLTVLEDETSRPLADVEVMILNYVDSDYHTFRTDSRGRLRFECLSTGSEPAGNIEVRKNGYVPLRYAWGFDGGPTLSDSLTLRLRRGTTMGGIVVAAADRPVGGVTVVMTVTRYGSGKRAAIPTGHEIYYEIPIRTGPDGRWRTDSVPPSAEEVHLQLIHPDFVCDGSTTLGWPGRSPKLAALRDQSDRQVLLKGVKISGRVLDDQGRPIAGARVVDSARGLTFLDYVWQTFTDGEGRFHIHLPRGKDVNLSVQVQGYQPATRIIAADPDHPAVEFRLPPGKRIRGRVVDPQGHPIEGAWIMSAGIPPQMGISFRKWTDAQGRFEWDSAPDHAVAFDIWAEGYLANDLVRLTARDTEAVIVLKPSVDVRLEVVDAETGKPIPGFRIEIGTPEPGTKDFRWGPPIGVVSEKSYRTSLDAEKGPYQLRINADGCAPAQILVVRGEGMKLREVIRLKKAPK